MRTQRHLWRVLVSAATLLATAPALATIVNYEYEGVVASFDGPGSILPSNFATGETISGVLSYDDAVSGSTTSSSGFYQQGGSTQWDATGSGVAFERGSFYRAQTTVLAGIFTRLEFTTFNPSHTGLVLPSTGERISSMNMTFSDSTGTALSGLALPASIDLLNWSSATLRVQAATASNLVDGHMYVNITRFAPPGSSVVSVPEPATYALLGLGLLGFSLGRRGRAR